MDPLFHLDNMLSDYQHVFKSNNNFTHSHTFVSGLIRTPHRGTMTKIYQSVKPSTTYWTLPKFLIGGRLRLHFGMSNKNSVLEHINSETEKG